MPGPTVSGSVRARVASTSIHSSPSSTTDCASKPAPSTTSREAVYRPPGEVPSREAVVGVFLLAVGSDLEMERRTDLHRPVQIGEGERDALGRHVHVALVGPGSTERRAPERQRLEVGLHAEGSRCVPRHEIEHRLGRVERDDGIAERSRVPTRAAAQIEPARAGRNVCGERRERLRLRPFPVHDPVGCVLLVHIDGAAVHDREEWQI